MLLHTNPTLSRVFARLSDPKRLREPAPLAELAPLLLVGRLGTGKRHYVREFIRHVNCADYRPFTTLDPALYTRACECEVCGRLEAALDYLELTGTETVAEMRKTVRDFLGHFPVQLTHRFLLLGNLQRYAKDRLDTLLKILEEPPANLKVFATATTTQSMPGAVLSRFRQLRHPTLTAEQLRTIVDATPRLKRLAPQLAAHAFRSVDELLLYVDYDFEAKFEAFWQARDIISLERAIRQFLQRLRKDAAHHTPDALEFFIAFFIQRVEQFCTTHAETTPALQKLRAALPAQAYRAYETLGRYLHAPDASSDIDVDNQVVALLTSLTVLRNVLRVSGEPSLARH